MISWSLPSQALGFVERVSAYKFSFCPFDNCDHCIIDFQSVIHLKRDFLKDNEILQYSEKIFLPLFLSKPFSLGEVVYCLQVCTFFFPPLPDFSVMEVNLGLQRSDRPNAVALCAILPF